MELESIIRKYALQNALKFEGKANAGAVIGKVISEQPHLKNNMKDIALKVNKIIKDVCVICGNKNTHGHHIDYKKPLEVIWLCPLHHTAIHKRKLACG